MKKFAILLFILFGLQIINAQDKVSHIRKRLLNPNEKTVLVAAHRGDWRNAPENSLPAISYAIEMGVDIVEIDIQKTKDGQFILMHDKTLDRTTNGKGKIAEWSLDSISKLNLKNGCGIVTKEKIPTFEEALMTAKGNVMLNLDKADTYFDDIFPLLIKTGTSKQIIMKGRKNIDDVKKSFGKYFDEIIYMPVIDLDDLNAKQNIQGFLNGLHPAAFEVLYKNDRNPLPKDIVSILNKKSLIWYNSLWDSLCGGHDDDEAMKDKNAAYGYLINVLGARIIQTDRPGLLIQYLKEKNLFGDR